jgi:hypothetical protein
MKEALIFIFVFCVSLVCITHLGVRRPSKKRLAELANANPEFLK